MRIRINSRVVTPIGPGTVVKIDNNDGRVKRYGIELDTNPFNFTPVYYWENEVKQQRAKEPSFYCRSFTHGIKTCVKNTQCDFCFLEAMNSRPKQ